jgi:hypothetical protein
MFNSNYTPSEASSISSQHSNFPFSNNPFEETNRFRLEQSVLSPNIFQIAHTSTPEVFFPEIKSPSNQII